MTSQWSLHLDPTWHVLGPFPIHAREQHFLSPAYPLNLSESIDHSKSWPSSYADNGLVTWNTTSASKDGYLSVQFPEIRWNNLRISEGWAALQHHAVLHTTLTIHPPDAAQRPELELPTLSVELDQASYFALRPQGLNLSSYVPEWYSGNIYAMERAPPIVVPLPSPASQIGPWKYDLILSGDYEIRLFGDPVVRGTQTPTQQIRINLQLQPQVHRIQYDPSQNVLCDFFNGFAFGSTFGLGFHSAGGWWLVENVTSQQASSPLGFHLPDKIRIAPSQRRIIPLRITQSAPFHDNNITLDIAFSAGDERRVLSVTVSVKHVDLGSANSIQGTFMFTGTTSSPFIAVPPRMHIDEGRAPILALHGAGVDVLTTDLWPNALPDNNYNWVVIPTGRTSWGLDWHGPSAHDAWTSVAALKSILEGIPGQKSWKPEEVIVIGHSNGGQGAWYIASRFPDRVAAFVSAAPYIKSQSYIPLSLSRSGHFIDPSLRAILESAFTPDDNDLFVTNLAYTPVLAIHGGTDENVPVWHSRELISLIRSWYPNANTTFHEDIGQGHWYPHVLDNARVRSFVEDMSSRRDLRHNAEAFTLTVSVPSESGSLHGFQIERVAIQGRLGRLRVEKCGQHLVVKTTNVLLFSVFASKFTMDVSTIIIDDATLTLSDAAQITRFRGSGPNTWEVVTDPLPPPAPTRLQSILLSRGPLIIVTSIEQFEDNLSVALRIAHALHLYHRIDAEVINDQEAVQRLVWPTGNVIFIGPASSLFARNILQQERTPVRSRESTLFIGKKRLNEAGQGILFLHPHPYNLEGLSLFILYHDKSGLERAARLFPFRTGVAVPSWVVTGTLADNFGTGGVEAAGIWDSDWGENKIMSWFG